MNNVNRSRTQFFITLFCVFFISAAQDLCAQQSNQNVTAASNFQPFDKLAIERITGIKGKSNKGEYKITIPQNDLNVVVDGFKIIPAMGLSTWIAFTPSKDGVMIMGDIVLTENDLRPVQ